jgi:hypothetical protein
MPRLAAHSTEAKIIAASSAHSSLLRAINITSKQLSSSTSYCLPALTPEHELQFVGLPFSRHASTITDEGAYTFVAKGQLLLKG